jgi:geranylgeranyl transferase type-2 subunit beta
MTAPNYLQRLTDRLSDGLLRLPAGERDSCVAFFRGSQQPDGGFPDREGGSDLYYTGFGLRGLAVLDALDGATATRAESYLRGCLTQQASVVDFYSLLYACLLLQVTTGIDVLADSAADWPERVARTLETFRTSDGGFAKMPNHPGGGSTYHSFLVGLCFELLNRPLPRPDEVVRFVLSRRREDGGFVEVAPMRRSGTNPTAAAVGLLRLAEQAGVPALTDEIREGVIGLIVESASDEGGLRANGRIPIADLLSTFTGCWTLADLGATDQINRDAAREYVQLLRLPAGGFRGGLWDEATDVEYSFYGLGVLGLLH